MTDALPFFPETAKPGEMIAVWFSRGAASAVAAKMTIRIFGRTNPIRIVTNPVVEEHHDNVRFERDVREWLGVPIEHALASDYPSASCVDVWEKTRGMSFPKGAPCTRILKKQARYEWEARNKPEWHVLGFTLDEKKRHDGFTMTERDNVIPVLIDLQITKQDCMTILGDAGIDVPEMYKLGFPNANCIGCVKATSPTYWNHVRKHFPDVFAERARQADHLGAKLVRVRNKRISLSDLDPSAKGRPMKSLKLECGSFCEEPHD